MKRLLILLMIAMMSISMIAYGEETTLAETTEEDYTYLDDMSINQLKALDAEIHKRLPVGNDNENTTNVVELNVENILDYVNIEITYELTDNTIIGPAMEETITIYPIRAGSFENVELLITGTKDDWRASSSELSESFLQYTSDAISVTLTKISLPSDGNYTCTHTYVGKTGLAKLPKNKDSTKGWKYISVSEINENLEKWLGADCVKVGDKTVTGTFKAD